jgi:UDP-N-acetylmuramoyl-L-alanyl-D-glutamate--2,6-diaminopimelate ligase
MLDSATRPPDDASGGRFPTLSPGRFVAGSTPNPSHSAEQRDLDLLLLALPPDSHQIRVPEGAAISAISGVTYRSGDVVPGALFFCVPGERTDGHRYAGEAVSAGASTLVVERWLDPPADRAVQVLVRSVREAMGPMSAAFYGWPGNRMPVVGVTGTNGKTTTTYLLEGVFRAAGIEAGVIGTTGVRVGGRPAPFDRTTPEAPDLQRLLASMLDAGVGGVAMEVSSHGLDQHRVDGTRFACVAFTNLSQDHLDYHGTLEAYFAAKARLFTPVFAVRGVVNGDDPAGRRLAAASSIPVVTFGLDADADIRATGVDVSPDGVRFLIDGLEVKSRLRAPFNVSNCLAAIAVARELGLDDTVTADGIASVEEVPGRLESIEAGQPFAVLIDYAHTPDSLANVLRAARQLTDGRVIAVFGCGGDRDRGKRPLMGEAVTSAADLAVITSDNPRSEDPVAIIAEIVPGAQRGGGSFLLEPDRRAAIRYAVSEARPGDLVLIAGKGHETGQEFADHTDPFDDREVAREQLRALRRERAERRKGFPS